MRTDLRAYFSPPAFSTVLKNIGAYSNSRFYRAIWIKDDHGGNISRMSFALSNTNIKQKHKIDIEKKQNKTNSLYQYKL